MSAVDSRPTVASVPMLIETIVEAVQTHADLDLIGSSLADRGITWLEHQAKAAEVFQ